MPTASTALPLADRTRRRAFLDSLGLLRQSQIEPVVTEVRSLSRQFLGIMHRRRPKEFDRWLQRLSRCEAPEMKSFARSLRADLPAVRAAFTLPWSNGQTEGHVNRLKFLKRQMYGRASIDLLRLRVLNPN
jgi:transposase